MADLAEFQVNPRMVVHLVGTPKDCNMAKPYKHPKTGTYYLRIKIPLDVRDGFQGRELYKQSLNTKDAATALSLFVQDKCFA